MGPRTARTTAVSPSSGPDFELPFVCGQSWTGTSRSGHSPSYYAIDFNTPNDLGRPAVASAPGVVTRAVTLTGSYGKYVVVDHGGGFSSLYAHLRNITTSVGTFLDQGDLLGYVGSTGGSTGPHLHFEERKDGAYFPPYFHRVAFRMGSTRSSANCGDRPIAGDWNDDGKADVGVQRSTPTTGEFRMLSRSTTTAFNWGAPSDTPLVGDWNGDGRSQIGNRRLGTSAFTLRSVSGRAATYPGIGSAIDTSVTGDWDGDRQTDLGVYRASNHTFYLRSASGTMRSVVWGAAGGRAVSGDWNKDGRTDIGTFSPLTAIWTLRVPRTHAYATRTVAFGRPGDLPVTGDWNGDKVADLGTWTPSTRTFTLRTPNGAGAYVTTAVGFGARR